MWTVTVYREDGYDIESYTKRFYEEDNALEFFEEEVKDEFRNEIEKGLISDQEIQNIINNNIYTYDSEEYEVTISLEVEDELDDQEEEDDYI